MADGLKTCGSCGASIVWSKTAHGKPIPLDPPLLTIVVDTTGVVVRGRISHFSTCPNADSHRKRPDRYERILDDNAERYELTRRAEAGFDVKTEQGLPIGHADTIAEAARERTRLEGVTHVRGLRIHWRGGDREIVTAAQARILLDASPTEVEAEPQTELPLDAPDPRPNSPEDVGFRP